MVCILYHRENVNTSVYINYYACGVDRPPAAKTLLQTRLPLLMCCCQGDQNDCLGTVVKYLQTNSRYSEHHFNFTHRNVCFNTFLAPASLLLAGNCWFTCILPMNELFRLLITPTLCLCLLLMLPCPLR